MRFLVTIHHEEKALDDMPAEQMQRLVDAALDYTEDLRRSGHYVASNALQRGRTARTLRVRDGKVSVTDGPYAETKEQLGGILLLEAKDLNHTIQLMSKHPGVRLGGPFEIRPAAEEINELVAARDRAAKQR